MKNNGDKDRKVPAITATQEANHHANASRVNPEIAAMAVNEHGNKKAPGPHDLNPDKRADTRRIHTNGSATSDRL